MEKDKRLIKWKNGAEKMEKKEQIKWRRIEAEG